MFNKLKEMHREGQAMAALNPDFEEVCPDAAQRASLKARFREISRTVESPHNESHILTPVIEMFRFRQLHPDATGQFVEAGCFKGSSTAKLSIVASMLDAELTVFDSFEGIPDNREAHDRSIFGYSISGWFGEGAFHGSLEEVQSNVATYGDPAVCSYVPGWFDATMPEIGFDIMGAYIDVDLASSTRTCLKYLYPRLVPGGFIVSQDGDFPLVIDVFEDDAFWEEEVGCKKPITHGLRSNKMLKIYKT